MKNRLFAAIALIVLCAANAAAYDWQPQSNEALRQDMLTFASGFADNMKGTRAGRQLRRFVKEQTELAASEPYAWIDATREMVQKLEAMQSPVPDDGSKAAEFRKNTLLLMDFPLHSDNKSQTAAPELKAAFGAVSEKYRADARDKALGHLAAPAPAPGKLEIIKVYNQGYIVRTSERTIAVDIQWQGDEAGARAIAAKASVFFLSHPHGDHYSPVMMKALAEAGKRVVLPSDVVPDASWPGKMVVDADILEPTDVEGIKMVIVRGRQGKVPNNGYLLEFDGWRIFLPGENRFDEFEAPFVAYEAPDVIMVPSWNRFSHFVDIMNRMPGYDPARTTFIPGHENELYHTVDHRESYRELFSRPDRLGERDSTYPQVILVDIGEKVTLGK